MRRSLALRARARQLAEKQASGRGRCAGRRAANTRGLILRMESRGEGPGPAGESSEMAAALRAAKQALRAELKRRLRALSQAEKQRQSRLLSRKVIGHSKYQESQRIAVFLSMQDEIETEEIIKDIFQRGKECFIPQYKPRSSHMDMVKLTSAEEISSLPLTSWNIHQPCDNDVREEALSGGGKKEEQEAKEDKPCITGYKRMVHFSHLLAAIMCVFADALMGNYPLYVTADCLSLLFTVFFR
ncbi:5-formyltetrahydrofolate cyclo-ligase isoform X2 [Chrysemys picta bellii]|uniref:5-formyltetrahydrofolate cyclo-ligase isoform X2 n=1 Tax=Chrysemys picta bellii TaxID=8478 RepID=UPI0032B0F497